MFLQQLRVEAAGGESSLNQLVSKFWESENVTPISPRRNNYAESTIVIPPRAIHVAGTSSSYHIVKILPLWEKPDTQHYISQYIQAEHTSYIAPAKDPEKIIYLPHQGVLKEDSSTTKLLVVFNASQKSTNGLALNDILMTGPVVQDTLYNILLNFRTHCIALTGDIEKMYLQIKVTSEDSKLIRMLWQEPGQPVAEYGMKTVTFGITCAPHLATRTLQQKPSRIFMSTIA
ncbi:uncharacterized protein LOC128735279 [Sabethes cyaneus]|uniref:uncharacterized protein LOC128735279 n=1 Tax=Sabethes cyaneus TaxID=53552 RepID=UPI00237DAB8E|nr:uncharacterized protein LOC128735279 [Sabethes cyaneus]